MTLFSAFLLSASLAAGPVAGPATAQDETASPDSLRETYGPWVVSCGPARTGCHMFQALRRTKDGARLVQVTVFAPAEGSQQMRALVPLGAKIAAGAVLQVDKIAPQTVPIDACWQRGCVAELALDSELEDRLRAGKTLAVSVVGADTGRTIRFELALKGFSAALDRLNEL
jgi:invasion protein IalB